MKVLFKTNKKKTKKASNGVKDGCPQVLSSSSTVDTFYANVHFICPHYSVF